MEERKRKGPTYILVEVLSTEWEKEGVFVQTCNSTGEQIERQVVNGINRHTMEFGVGQCLYTGEETVSFTGKRIHSAWYCPTKVL